MISRASVHSLEARMQPHLDRLKLGALFDGYSAHWSGREAAEMIDCIEEMCHILDVIVPQALEHAWNLRRTQLGLPSRSGLVLQSYAQNALIHSTHLDILSSTCGLLRKSVDGRHYTGWNKTGCGALHVLLGSMIKDIKVSFFRLLDEIAKADSDHVNKVLQLSDDI